MYNPKLIHNNKVDKSKTILTIDDDYSIRELLEILLSRKYSVVGKENGFDAMVWMDSGNIPDLIIADFQMPKINGLEFLQKIRKSGFYRDVPIIFLSGIVDEELKSLCFKSGAKDFLRKPFNPNVLISKIESLIESGVTT
jgi:CheY-like chemotaxis protein